MSNTTQNQYEMPPEEHFREVLNALDRHDEKVDNFALIEFLKVSARIQVKHLNSVDTPTKKRYSRNNSKR